MTAKVCVSSSSSEAQAIYNKKKAHSGFSCFKNFKFFFLIFDTSLSGSEDFALIDSLNGN